MRSPSFCGHRMSESRPDLLAVNRGAIVAPAGCGKTHLIAEALTRHSARKPILVLTHTNAGVAALRGHLRRASVAPASYQLSTLDGWAMKLVATFPKRSGANSELLRLVNPGTDYANIRELAARLLHAGHINEILAASYDRLVVDEYQDSSIRQHALVYYASKALPTCVLGDPMQAIFDFGKDPLAPWDTEVMRRFPTAAELTTPWRWINAGAEGLGRWLLVVRAKLMAGEQVDLASAPPEVKWVRLSGSDDHKLRLAAALMGPPQRDGRTLIIGDSTSPDSQRLFASQTPGAVAIESVDLRDFVRFAGTFDCGDRNALKQLVGFAETVMNNVGGSDLMKRADIILAGRARKPPTPVEAAAVTFAAQPSFSRAAALLSELEQQGGVRTYRPAVLRACTKALRLCDSDSSLSFADAAIQMREQNRALGRPLPNRAVGSTLLLKGLEAEVVVLLDVAKMNTKNLYVALTRGSRSVVVCSPSQMLPVAR